MGSYSRNLVSRLKSGGAKELQKIQTTEFKLDIDEIEGGFTASSDRMCAFFERREDIPAFADRCKKFLAKLHETENRAGFFLLLPSDFGADGCSGAQLAIYFEALKIEADPEGDPWFVAAAGMSNDEVADAWSMMSTPWSITPGMDFSVLDGTWSTLRDFFVENADYDGE